MVPVDALFAFVSSHPEAVEISATGGVAHHDGTDVCAATVLRVLRGGTIKLLKPHLFVNSIWRHEGRRFAPYVQSCAAECFSEYVSPVRSGKRSSYLNLSSGSTDASSQTASGLRATAFSLSMLLQTLMNAYRPSASASTSSVVICRFLRWEKIPLSPSCRRRRGAPWRTRGAGGGYNI